MRKFLVPLLILLWWTPADATNVAIGQNVTYHYNLTQDYNAIVTRVVSGTTVNLVAFANGDAWWQDGNYGTTATVRYTSVDYGAQGIAANTWSESAIGVGATGATGATGAQGAQGTTGPSALVTNTSSGSYTLNGSGIQCSSTKDCEIDVSVDVSGSVTVSGGYDGDVTLLCDTSATPTTVVEVLGNRNTGTVVVGLALTVGGTLLFHATQPAAQFCRFTTTNNVGTPTYTIRKQIVRIKG